MPEGVGYSGANSPLSTGLELTIVNNDAYAYSGILSINNTETDLLNFRTGNKTIKAKIQFFYAADNSDNYLYKVYFNEVAAFAYIVGDADSHFLPSQIPVIIPPYTKVRCTADNISASNAINQACLFVGSL